MAKIIWKTKREIEEEKNKPKEPTELDLLKEEIEELKNTIDTMLGVSE